VLLVGARLLGATTLQDYGLALFVGLLSGAYSSIFIAAPVLALLKRGESRWVAIEQRLGNRADRADSFSASDAATMSTQIAIATGGQSRGGGSGAPKRTGPIRPGSGASAGNGNGTGTTAVGRPSGDGGRAVPKPRKGKGKRQR
jgi:preprotein translocase subunit SecF